MARYKAGDRVRVRNDLKTSDAIRRNKYYMDDGKTCDIVIEEMLEYCGQVMTISRVSCDGKYVLLGAPCRWTDEMLVGANINISNEALVSFL